MEGWVDPAFCLARTAIFPLVGSAQGPSHAAERGPTVAGAIGPPADACAACVAKGRAEEIGDESGLHLVGSLVVTGLGDARRSRPSGDPLPGRAEVMEATGA
jgi:hypothetical protein